MTAAANVPEVAQLVDHLFRRESGRLVAILVRRFGVRHLHLAEDVVQEALVKATQTWPLSGIPENPSAWLLQTARNRALDQARRDSRWREKQVELAPLIEECLQSALAGPAPRFEDEIGDSQLRMMFVCCHPGLPREAQVALILKALCGFGEREIAAAFLASEAAVAKRLVRARQFLREQDISLELPPGETLAARVNAVQQALYLLFNEGYKASHGDSLLRADLCAEAIRLTELLGRSALGDRPDTRALLALMCLNAARLPARVDDDGSLLVLAEQDRRRWDRSQVQRGLEHLAAASRGERVTSFHLEAGIAACHALAPDFATTNWRHILVLYDRLRESDGSPVVALNRAVALAQVEGPHCGLDALAEIEDRASLEHYHLFHAVAGQLWFTAGESGKASACFRRALDLAALPAERALLERRLAQCGGARAGP